MTTVMKIMAFMCIVFYSTNKSGENAVDGEDDANDSIGGMLKAAKVNSSDDDE